MINYQENNLGPGIQIFRWCFIRKHILQLYKD